MAKKVVKLIFSEALICEPVIYQIGHKFDLITNIKQANVTRDSGYVVLEIEGISEEINQAIAYLRTKGIKIEIFDSCEYIDF